MSNRNKKAGPWIVYPQAVRKPTPPKKRRSGRNLNRLVWGVLLVTVVVLYFAPDRSDVFGQRTYWQHNGRHEQPAGDESEARKAPKTAIAMLELYGNDDESQWASNVAKGR